MRFLVAGMLILAEVATGRQPAPGPLNGNLPSLRRAPKPHNPGGWSHTLNLIFAHLCECAPELHLQFGPLKKSALPGLYETSVEQRRAKRDTAKL